jgi:hypothetical protein
VYLRLLNVKGLNEPEVMIIVAIVTTTLVKAERDISVCVSQDPSPRSPLLCHLMPMNHNHNFSGSSRLTL